MPLKNLYFVAGKCLVFIQIYVPNIMRDDTLTYQSDTFGGILDQIRSESKTNKDLGDKFERLMIEFFKKDNRYGWRDVRKPRGQDLGIDIIGYDRLGEQWAVQCKCYADNATLDYDGNVTNFWAECEHRNIKNRIIVTTARPSHTLDKQCRRTGIRIIKRYDLEASKITWDTNPAKIHRHKAYKLREHQKCALKNCLNGFRMYDRGQLLMACGTGKTLTALHVAEQHAGCGRLVLYLVPSISLVKQTVQEWAENANMPHRHLIVCSDTTVKGTDEDISVTDLVGNVTTDPARLREQYQIATRDGKAMCVVFSTYQSAGVVQEAFAGYTFDLILFDEAHRTAGNSKKSFALAHYDTNISAAKRLYMTATPRIYTRKSATGTADVVSMNDAEVFGPVFHKLKFSDAIAQNILSDYQVVGFEVVADDIDEANAKADEESEFTLEEECKLSSVYEAIRQQDIDHNPNLLNRILVFHNKIVQSKNFAKSFNKIVERVNRRMNLNVAVDVQHIDGKDRARDRGERIEWLKAASQNKVHVLSNARCLSEGVDVPTLDGVVFYEPRQSVVDVVQAVGRVMRKAGGKRMGYVIVPVVVSRNENISDVVDRSKGHKLTLQILEALRAHDDRIDRFFNQAALVADPSGLPDKDTIRKEIPVPPQLKHIFDTLPPTLLNTGFYWEEYGRKLGEKAAVVAMQATHRDTRHKEIIDSLHENLKAVVGDTVTRKDAIEAVAQHIVLQPVFRKLFGKSTNPVVAAFDHVVDRLDFHTELADLKEWHEVMEYHIGNITSQQAKQTLIAKIYGNFFESFDKKQARTIVYTPVEVVDFIINSIQHVLEREFGAGFADESVKVLDPFAGTGLFLVRLLESGHIPADLITSKYHDMAFGENKLLAYYTACANLETAHSRITETEEPFEQGCYVDTFTVQQRYRKLKMEGRAHVQTKITDPDFRKVYQMRYTQQEAHIHVIMGNPPYSAGRKTASEDLPNTSHPELEQRITATYKKSIPEKMTRTAALRNQYVKALRWVSDRIGESGAIGFITPSAWITGNVESGIRACIREEFTDIYILNLRGNAKLQGEGWRREGGKIFGGGSRESTAIVILVKNPSRGGGRNPAPYIITT